MTAQEKFDALLKELGLYEKWHASEYAEDDAKRGRSQTVLNITYPPKYTYCVINTSIYDGGYADVAVTIAKGKSQLLDDGFAEDEAEKLIKMEVGETRESEDYGKGVIVVRIA